MPLSPTPSPAAPFAPGTVRWTVLAAMEDRTHWTVEQLATAVGLDLELVDRAVCSLRELGFARPASWTAAEVLYEFTAAGHRRLNDGGQEALI